ncbi:hypothetical protein [Pimelobacter sp. 30-1]|uniref:hypothetical protein n=1 Tax=Pimelobacter sp. 30-1 TaxID=2004991 RepID=UPI001C04F316|nr:hypothetical protein [Pimelobacter sp. 30-1]
MKTCTGCGEKHRARTFDTCPACRRTDDGLTGGRWVQAGAVRRWRPWTDAERAERARQLPAALAEWRRRRR